MKHTTLQPDIRAVGQIHDFIMQDLKHPLPPIKTLANQVCMSVSKLRALFLKVYGTNIYTYHLNARMELAKTLIISNEYTITQIAYMVGFNHHQSFIKSFTKYANQSPNKYKESAMASKALIDGKV
jgi:AraC-like DNA-binding protein